MRALLSTYDKTGVVDLAHALADAGWDLVSSGGTAAAIAEAGIAVTDVADLTGMLTLTGWPAGMRVIVRGTTAPQRAAAVRGCRRARRAAASRCNSRPWGGVRAGPTLGRPRRRVRRW